MTVPGNLIISFMASISQEFPVVESRAATAEGGATTGHNVNLASGAIAGDLLIVSFATDGNPSIDWSGTGFTEFFSRNNGSAIKLAIAYKLSTGGETSINVTTGAAERVVSTAYRISGAKDPSSQPPEASTGATGASTSPNPDSLTPTGGSKKYLWLAVAGCDGGFNITSYPTSYTDGLTRSGTSLGATIGTAERLLEASIDNPAVFTYSSSDQWVAITIAVHPA